LQNHTWVLNIIGPLTVLVLTQFLMLRQHTDDLVLQAGIQDKDVWKWTPSGTYSSSSAYRDMFLGQVDMAGAKEIWKVKAPNEYRFFVWLTF
jgi:hypothetical protein